MALSRNLDRVINAHQYCKVCGDRVEIHNTKKYPICTGCVLIALHVVPLRRLLNMKRHMFASGQHKVGKLLHMVYKKRRDTWGESI